MGEGEAGCAGALRWALEGWGVEELVREDTEGGSDAVRLGQGV